MREKRREMLEQEWAMPELPRDAAEQRLAGPQSDLAGGESRLAEAELESNRSYSAVIAGPTARA